MQVGGCLNNSRLQGECKNPIIIPKESHITMLIALDQHNVAHCGSEWVTSQIRKHYWNTGVRALVKSISRSCMFCKKMFTRPCHQKMSDLPPDKLEAGHKPFTYTGIDCFGPFLIKRGCAEVKRYVCLFACMNTRAIHFEKLNAMDTDSFINGFRFAACRGMPRQVWSDNGTYFTGGCSEMNRSYKQLHEDMLKDYGVEQGIEWKFNPPHASHMGGAWKSNGWCCWKSRQIIR